MWTNLSYLPVVVDVVALTLGTSGQVCCPSNAPLPLHRPCHDPGSGGAAAPGKGRPSAGKEEEALRDLARVRERARRDLGRTGQKFWIRPVPSTRI